MLYPFVFVVNRSRLMVGITQAAKSPIAGAFRQGHGVGHKETISLVRHATGNTVQRMCGFWPTTMPPMVLIRYQLQVQLVRDL